MDPQRPTDWAAMNGQLPPMFVPHRKGWYGKFVLHRIAHFLSTHAGNELAFFVWSCNVVGNHNGSGA